MMFMRQMLPRYPQTQGDYSSDQTFGHIAASPAFWLAKKNTHASLGSFETYYRECYLKGKKCH